MYPVNLNFDMGAAASIYGEALLHEECFPTVRNIIRP